MTTDTDLLMALQLKQFIVKSAKASTADLKCPRTDCGGVFTVDRKLFGGPVTGGTHKRDIDTRPCPYCFRVSLRPKKVRRRARRA